MIREEAGASAYAVAACPVKKCSGRFKVTHATPPGEYDCVCHHARLRLAWVEGRVPRLAVVERGAMP